MFQQHSFKSSSNRGELFLVPTPIGNLEDMTFRAIRILKEVDLIAAEDTRQTIKLCNHYEITTKLVSYHDHNKEMSGSKLIEQLHNGKNIALVSDAGTPAISDPGYELVRDCLAEKISVIALPGANAALTALIASGLATNHFYFFGFLDRKKKVKKQELEQVKSVNTTLVFYEAPHRLKETLETMQEVLGDRNIAVCRELTKKHEEYIRGSISEVIQWCSIGTVKGEFCIIVDGSDDSQEPDIQWWDSLTITEHIEHHMSQKMSSKEAIKQVAIERGIQKREVYAIYHHTEES